MIIYKYRIFTPDDISRTVPIKHHIYNTWDTKLILGFLGFEWDRVSFGESVPKTLEEMWNLAGLVCIIEGGKNLQWKCVSCSLLGSVSCVLRPVWVPRLVSQVENVAGYVLLCGDIRHYPWFVGSCHLQTTYRTVSALPTPAETGENVQYFDRERLKHFGDKTFTKQ